MTEKSLTLFVNYRHADKKVFVELLRTHFMFRYGQDNVFMDFDTIPPFVGFLEFIKDRVRACDVLVMMIGKDWLKLLKGKEANGDPDYVKMELEEALKHNIPIAPILIQGARMPDKKDVPTSLHPIWDLNAPSIGEGRDLLNNIGYIMNGFEQAVIKGGKQRKVENLASVQQLVQLPKTADGDDLDDALDNFIRAVQANDYPQALVWISYIRNATNAIPPEFELDARERDIQERLRHQQEAKRRRDVCDFQYKFVRRMLRLNDPPDKIKAFVQKIWQIDEGYIPDDLIAQLRPMMGGGTIITPTKPKITLPAPFDWCYIPEGQVTFGPEDGYDKDFYAKKKTTVPVPAFWMAKYPVTNKQYREFVTATGKKPRYWDNAKWNGDDYPVVGMTWYEAVAFCEWLSNKTGEKIMLPSDAMWQRAAQGDDERKFPWGNVWDASLCNNNVDKKGIGKTTPVRDYEDKYTHPYGLVDMAGNVREWCLTTYKTGENRTTGDNNDWRVLMGGSWGTEVAGRFVSAFRFWNYPFGRDDEFIGFRLARL